MWSNLLVVPSKTWDVSLHFHLPLLSWLSEQQSSQIMEGKPRVEDVEKANANPNSPGSLMLRLFQRRQMNLHLFKAHLFWLLL